MMHTKMHIELFIHDAYKKVYIEVKEKKLQFIQL
jgi:hypothetical protein